MRPKVMGPGPLARNPYTGKRYPLSTCECPYWHGSHVFAPAWYSETAVVKRCICGKVKKEALPPLRPQSDGGKVEAA